VQKFIWIYLLKSYLSKTIAAKYSHFAA